MDNVFFLVLRRMRRPLLTLVVVYSISVFGLTLIPGQDADGNVWYMGFFHAFYFVSFMSTTIGFGEIPYPFTDAQRIWVTFSLYISVISWLYAAGNILSLLQDKTFQNALREKRFAKRINGFSEDFYLVCGYGETGRELTQVLTDSGRHVVVIDGDEDRINLIKLQDMRDYVPALKADARKPRHLLEAGLEHDNCKAVIALTNDNESNLKIAITAKLLYGKEELKVICRADSHDIEANMASFGTDHIIDPFDIFARHLSIALQMPNLYLLHRWFTEHKSSGDSMESARMVVQQDPLWEQFKWWFGKDKQFDAAADTDELQNPVYPPAKGHWIICGYGRFGRAVYARLRKEVMSIAVIEATPELTGEPKEGVVQGRGTEAVTLEQADIENAVGIVAGTDNDANNLSIIMTAMELNENLFVIARQNRRQNDALFERLGEDKDGSYMVMRAGTIIADKIRMLLTTPMLYQFLSLSTHQDNAWVCELNSRIIGLVSNSRSEPVMREIILHKETYCGIGKALEQGVLIQLADIMRDAGDRSRHLDCIALLLQRRGSMELLPAADTELQLGDKILFSGSPSAFTYMSWILRNQNTLNYVITGKEKPNSWVWKKMTRFSRRFR